MSIKLKALGLGLLAAMAMSAVAVMNAGAETGGHFTSSASHTDLVGKENNENHSLHFVRKGAAEGERIGCINDSYTGTISGTTVTEVEIKPSWSTCKTTGSSTHFDVVENGCVFKFTVGKQTHNTAHLVCPAGSAVEIKHPGCTIKVPSQTVNGVAYPSNGKHITLESTAQGITSHYEAGICVFLGTTQESEMNGSVTVEGLDEAGNTATIAATG